MQGQIRRNGTFCKATTWKKEFFFSARQVERQQSVTLMVILMDVPGASVGRGGLPKPIYFSKFLP